MNKCNSIFGQILQVFNWYEFERMVRETKSEKGTKGFSSWDQFVAMLFCQWGQAHSLREIWGGLAICLGKMKHLGMKGAPHRSTLAYANEHRPWELYQKTFYSLLEKCPPLSQGKKKFRFKNKLLSLDASILELCSTLFDWARFRQTKGAVKLHLLLDHEGYLPVFALITEGAVHEVNIAHDLSFPKGSIIAVDRGYTDYSLFARWTDTGVYFVTRQKDNASYRVMVLLTNHLEFGATTIARIYQDRWQMEIFFKTLKQNLKIKTLVGTSQNALFIQIWTALITILLLKYLQFRSTLSWSLSTLVALLRYHLFTYRDFWSWINHPFEVPVIVPQGVMIPLPFKQLGQHPKRKRRNLVLKVLRNRS